MWLSSDKSISGTKCWKQSLICDGTRRFSDISVDEDLNVDRYYKYAGQMAIKTCR